MLFAALGAYLLIGIAIESWTELKDMREQIKVLYFLSTAAFAGYLFAKVFDPRDSKYILHAIELGILAYIFAGCIGYLYPLSTFTWQLDAGTHFKSLFRYPGMSNSNYIAHVLLVLLAIHNLVADRSRQFKHSLFYLATIVIIAVVSQSRSFVITSIIMLLTFSAIRILRAQGGFYLKRKTDKRLSLHFVVWLLVIGGLASFSEFFIDLGGQTIDRFSVTSSSTVNIGRRFDEWRDTFSYFVNTDRSMLFGNLSYPSNLRPHNVILSVALVFGVPIACIVLFLAVLLVLRIPMLLFIIIAAQVEILFVTGVYDFVFFMILTVLSAPENWTSEKMLYVKDQSSGEVHKYYA
tara:strand:- start:23933 stop:24982 length:1050 start_codon:yes stop_codon:yes gene_type:complete